MGSRIANRSSALGVVLEKSLECFRAGTSRFSFVVEGSEERTEQKSAVVGTYPLELESGRKSEACFNLLFFGAFFRFKSPREIVSRSISSPDDVKPSCTQGLCFPVPNLDEIVL